MKVSDLISKFLKDHGMHQVFSVTGGFAMHLNDSFGKSLNVSYHNGEAQCGYAAIGWGEPCTVCVTAGCGATNAITPCLIAWQDSVPILFMSGAVKTTESTRENHPRSRTYSGSDCDIIPMVRGITKYAHEIETPIEVLNVLSRAHWNLTNGRRGPVWISVPLDIQSMDIPDELYTSWVPPDIKQFDLPDQKIFKNSERPLVIVGNGFHGCDPKKITVPFVVSFFGSDIPGYVGKIGVIGDKNGNDAFRQADLVIALGCRMSKMVTGYGDLPSDKRIIQVDIDENEFHKQGIEYIYCDAQTFLESVNWPDNKWFLPKEQPRPDRDPDNPYTILDSFFEYRPENSTVVISSGSIACTGWHAYTNRPGDKFIMSGHGDMGFEIPVAIGHAMRTGRRTFCIIGDGALQYSIPELMNLKNLPVTILCFNNGGYGAIKITQRQYFEGREYGTNFEFPSLKKLADVYGIPYFTEYTTVDSGPCIVEFFVRVQPRLWRS